ncbi:MAG: C4-dicarboxylate ABC transporter permease [Deltaproteobacteria bacterium]|nr:TRAP transporter large permease [Deltaproteobacteria bacterium]RLA90819.1 MAG: C4-dicarboxylate ABC transporter permease [Deltaproteobacteria bacterium]
MSLSLIGILGILILLAVLFFLGMPVGFAMAVVGFLGVCYVISLKAALGMLGTDIWRIFSSYGLTVIPLFIFMGEISFYSGVNERLYNTTYKWMGQIRGGIAMATVLACTGFSAICGSNTATAATMSTVALPEMKKYNYEPVLSTGSIACGSTLGVVIPPSVVLIIIGLETGQSIARLFYGGVLPGIILALLFMLTIYILCRLNPGWGPAGPKTTIKEKIFALPGSIEMLILFGLVMGGLYRGYFTPTEAGAAGSFFALLISIVRRKLSWKGFINSVLDTLRISCMILIIVTGAVIFGRFLTVTRLPYEAAIWASSLPIPRYIILAIVLFIYIIGGAVMDALALLLITIPVFFPMAIKLGYEPLWFGVIITVITTMGAVTPPVGVNTYVVAGMAKDIPLEKVFKGVTFFLPSYIICVILLTIFPKIITYLPSFVK